MRFIVAILLLCAVSANAQVRWYPSQRFGDGDGVILLDGGGTLETFLNNDSDYIRAVKAYNDGWKRCTTHYPGYRAGGPYIGTMFRQLLQEYGAAMIKEVPIEREIPNPTEATPGSRVETKWDGERYICIETTWKYSAGQAKRAAQALRKLADALEATDELNSTMED